MLSDARSLIDALQSFKPRVRVVVVEEFGRLSQSPRPRHSRQTDDRAAAAVLAAAGDAERPRLGLRALERSLDAASKAPGPQAAVLRRWRQ
eukprot:1881833-Rhodomonas_salina.1